VEFLIVLQRRGRDSNNPRPHLPKAKTHPFKGVVGAAKAARPQAAGQQAGTPYL